MALAPRFPSSPSFKHPPTGIDGASRPSRATDSVLSTTGSSQPLFVSFNQDYACFACGTETGFRIFSCDPFRETLRREFHGGGLFLNNGRRNPRLESDGAGIGIVEMLFRSNILALVGGGRAPRYSPNKVMIWDDHQGRCIGELLFRSEVRAVRLRRDRIVVVLEHKIYVYNLGDLKIMHQVETLANPKGLCSLSPVTNSCVMACPGLHRGEVRIELYSNKKTRFIQAHTSSLACLSLCSNGSLLATASTKGTLIRIFSTTEGSKLRELRRGTDSADIYSLAFSSNCNWLAASSDKGTIHVFNIRFPWSSQEDVQAADGPHMSWSTYSNLSSSMSNGFQMARSSLLSLASVNNGPSLSFMRGMLPKYFSSEWSFAQFRLPEDTHALVAFGPQKNTIVVVCSNGSFYRCAFDPVRGGEMVQQDYVRFMKPDVGAL